MRVAFWCTPGSSPHARGTQCSIVRTRQNPRFIPACAGNATFQDLADVYMSVHPRMRGERIENAHLSQLIGGSSPHARGTRESSTGRRWPASVHPRMRGERYFRHDEVFVPFGSSPHARGTLPLVDDTLQVLRFIPACAGNAIPPIVRRFPHSVHPRMRGERHADGSAEHVARGSSPHARGTPSTCYGKDGFPRFIPACAGNASGAFDDVQILAVHPRMRGERNLDIFSRHLITGSSPHARGTHGANGVCGSGGRFIPACAGNAFRRVPAVGRDTVHPRMRGERRGRGS